MDIIVPIIILILLFITCSICGYCCKRNKQGIVYGTTQPGTVTISTASNYQSTPYPVMETPMPQPAAVPAPVGFSAPYPPPGGAPYPTGGAPYPPATSAYPPATPYPPGAAPYPSMPMPGQYTAPVPAYPATATNQMPPSYAEAIGNSRVNEGYAKQAPYNPNYN